MKDNAFDRAMSQIVNEAHAEQQRDLRIQRRQQMIARVKVAIFFLIGLASLSTAFCYRGELQQFVSSKLETKHHKVAIVDGKVVGETNSSEGAAAINISKAAENASKRDAIIEQGFNAK